MHARHRTYMHAGVARARGVLVCGRAPNSGDSYALWRVMGTGARRGQRTALVRGEAGRRKTDKVGSKVLRALWAEQLRKRGYIVPTRVPALALLRPRGCTYPVDPGTVLGDGQQLAIDVCAAVERHVFSLFVFGNDGGRVRPERLGDPVRGRRQGAGSPRLPLPASQYRQPAVRCCFTGFCRFQDRNYG